VTGNRVFGNGTVRGRDYGMALLQTDRTLVTRNRIRDNADGPRQLSGRQRRQYRRQPAGTLPLTHGGTGVAAR